MTSDIHEAIDGLREMAGDPQMGIQERSILDKAAEAIEGLIASRDEARSANQRLAGLAWLGFRLSLWAATIRWGQAETNTASWLAGLKERIRDMQAAYKVAESEGIISRTGGEDAPASSAPEATPS
jgi:hypothetical protein